MNEESRQKLAQLFRQTAADRLERLSGGLLRLEQGGGADVLQELARELHTLKGESQLMGYAGLSQVLHATEDVLRARPEGAPVDALLEVCDAVPGFLDGPPDGGEEARRLVERLRGLVPAAIAAVPERPVATPPPAAAPMAAPVRPAANGASQSATAPAPGMPTIRVDVDRLEQIAAMAGDLLVEGARAKTRTRDLAGLFGRWSRLAEGAVAVADRMRQRGDGESATRLERDVDLLRSDTFRFLRRHFDAVDAVHGQLGRMADRVGEARLIPLSTLLAGFPRAARDLAREQGKELECVVRGADAGVDRAILTSLGDPLVHLLRNAVDHGLEPPEERERAGKPRAGRIEIAVHPEGGLLAVTVADDGRGVDVEAVRRAALTAGLVAEPQLAALTERAALDLIFHPGFTTRPRPEGISGRGIGLDVVRRKVTGLGGSVVVESAPGRGTRFILRAPQSLSLVRVLLVRVDADVYGIPAADVESVGRIDPAELTEVAGIRAVRHRDRLVPVVALGPMLSLNGGPRARRPAAAFVTHGREAAALVVDGLAGQREVAVKSLGAFLQGRRFVSGAAVLEDGRAALLLSTPDLVAAARRLGATPGPSPAGRRLRILLVDDSAIARETEAAMLRGLGHDVVEATDGEEGWRALAEGGHQLLLTDVRMPRLDGIELTRRVKGSSRFAHLPVVILSSLAAPEERRRGMDAGADAYLVKGELDPESLAATVERLCGVPR